MASLMLRPIRFAGGIRQMTSKQSLAVAMILVAITIAMLIVATGDRDADGYQRAWWQAGALIPVGHHHRWQNIAHHDPSLVYDDDCDSSLWSDNDDDCDLFAGYEGQFRLSYFGGPRSAATQPRDTSTRAVPPYPNSPSGSKLALALLLQQFIQ
jgi:hypothetical protein